jgi:hypothetical protein
MKEIDYYSNKIKRKCRIMTKKIIQKHNICLFSLKKLQIVHKRPNMDQ